MGAARTRRYWFAEYRGDWCNGMYKVKVRPTGAKVYFQGQNGVVSRNQYEAVEGIGIISQGDVFFLDKGELRLYDPETGKEYVPEVVPTCVPGITVSQ